MIISISKTHSSRKEINAFLLLTFILSTQVSGQSQNYRPYNRIQNIFDNIFRGPPGPSGPNAPIRLSNPQNGGNVPGSSLNGGRTSLKPGIPVQNPPVRTPQAANHLGPQLPPNVSSKSPKQLPKTNNPKKQIGPKISGLKPPLPPPKIRPRPPSSKRQPLSPLRPRAPPNGRHKPAPPPIAHHLRRPLPLPNLPPLKNGQILLPHQPKPLAPSNFHPKPSSFLDISFGSASSGTPVPTTTTTSSPPSSPSPTASQLPVLDVIDELNRDVPTLSGPVADLVSKPSNSGGSIRTGNGNGNIVIRPIGQVDSVPFFSDLDLQDNFFSSQPDTLANDVGEKIGSNASDDSPSESEDTINVFATTEAPSSIVHPQLDVAYNTLSPGFRLKPRGHSGPVIISKIPVKSFQAAAANQITAQDAIHKPNVKDEPTDGFYFAKANAEQKPVTSILGAKTPRFLDIAESVQHFQTLAPLITEHSDHHQHHADERSDKDYHQHHHNHHKLLDSDTISKRIDDVRELVDCGGSDLGFCDMSSKYPGHMMGSLMSECKELVYSGFVPVPEDLDELHSDKSELNKYSNTSKSSVRAQEGSWSWKPYTYQKKQICDSEQRFIRPGYALDTSGKWQVIVQTETLPQRVAIDLCHANNQPCHMMSDCGRKSRCIQRYNFQHLLAIDPDNLHHCPTLRAFKFPSACVCHVELENPF